ncbi:MAG: hypothetical protein MUQ41_07020, partial [Loktanella sp.]|nr:hypothetical protein [Loktanella sp.]
MAIKLGTSATTDYDGHDLVGIGNIAKTGQGAERLESVFHPHALQFTRRNAVHHDIAGHHRISARKVFGRGHTRIHCRAGYR